MLFGLQGDTMRLTDPVALHFILANNGAVVVSNGILLVMSLIFVIPIFMSFLTLILKYPAIRWANLTISLFFAAFHLISLALALFQ